MSDSNSFIVAVAPAFVPPYPVPTRDGEVVRIAGDGGPVTAAGGGSSYPTNSWADVGPPEIGGAAKMNEMLWGGDAGCGFMPSFSVAGAIAIAGGGGHHGTNIFGCGLFDFTDGRWKRIWTTNGVRGDNITTELVDLRPGTRVHNLLNLEDDIHDLPRTATGGHHADGGTDRRYDASGNEIPKWTGPCWNHEHWLSDPVLLFSGIPADPRDARWEVTRMEPYPWSATQAMGTDVSGRSRILSGPHGWRFPGEWPNGLQSDVTGRTVDTVGTKQGLFGNSTRFSPTVGMPLPIPGHTWDLYFDIPPSRGGGNQGSIGFMRSTYAGHSSSSAVNWSWRFDFETGTWHEWSANDSSGGGLPPGAPGGTPWGLAGATAGAYDPVTDRLFIAGQHFGSSSEGRLNYLNMADRTWRNLSVGVSTPAITAAGTGRTENIKVDPVRRLLIASCEIAPHVRAFDLATLGRTGAPEPTPSEGTGGWWHLPITAAPGFSIDAATNRAMRIYNLGWHYYPPNGKYYRCIPNLLPKPEDLDEYNALGDFHFTRLQRLTPPAIIPDPPESYYVTEPWVYDEIEVGSAEQQPDDVAIPLPRSPYHNQDSAIGNKWFWYVPALQCFAYFPLDNGSNGGSPTERTVSRHCVYLIKPY